MGTWACIRQALCVRSVIFYTPEGIPGTGFGKPSLLHSHSLPSPCSVPLLCTIISTLARGLIFKLTWAVPDRNLTQMTTEMAQSFRCGVAPVTYFVASFLWESCSWCGCCYTSMLAGSKCMGFILPSCFLLQMFVAFHVLPQTVALLIGSLCHVSPERRDEPRPQDSWITECVSVTAQCLTLLEW